MLNVCVLVGNLGGDPEITYTNNGDPVANFNLAFKSTKEKTGWIKVVSFGKLAEISQNYLTKGSKIAVTGILEQDKWQTSDGDTKTAYKLIANNIEFVRVNNGEGQSNSNNENNGDDEDLPF